MADAAMKGGNFALNNTVAPRETKVMSLFSLKGRTAIVSGGGAGIGFAITEAFAEAGANIAIWYNSNKKALDRAAQIEKEYGVKCKAYQVNVQDPAAVDEAIRAQTAEFNNRLDIFVANSGIAWTQGPMIDGEISHYQKVMTTDLDGTFYCARTCGALWREQKKNQLDNFRAGAFIATASISGRIVNIPQMQAAYNAAKAGIIHLCKSLAVEWVGFARVNSVSPGYFNTEILDFVPADTRALWKEKTPMGREGEVPELKGAYLYLASDASSYTTGIDLVVDGGYHCP